MFYRTPIIRGPLQMFPPADDNYGSEASHIMIMNTIPPCVVISSHNGIVYHALMLETYLVNQQQEVS